MTSASRPRTARLLQGRSLPSIDRTPHARLVGCSRPLPLTGLEHADASFTSWLACHDVDFAPPPFRHLSAHRAPANEQTAGSNRSGLGERTDVVFESLGWDGATLPFGPIAVSFPRHPCLFFVP